MTIDQIETSEDTAKGLLVTDAAVEKVLEARSEEEESEKLALRVQIIGVNGPEFSYDLSFESVDEALDNDVVSTIGDLTVLVPEESYENLNGATLDLPSNPMQGGLVIRNPNRPNMLEGEDLELTGSISEKLQQLLDCLLYTSDAADE